MLEVELAMFRLSLELGLLRRRSFLKFRAFHRPRQTVWSPVPALGHQDASHI
jgi:hypothetical protein